MATTTNPPIQYIVLLMLENRSYDNVLGLLYGPKSTKLNGVVNALPNVDSSTGTSYTVWWKETSDATTIPQNDPGETFEAMAQQFLGLPQAAKSVLDPSPYPSGTDLSTAAGSLGLMQGFVTNFVQLMQEGDGWSESPGDVMHCFRPELLPITAWLAKNYMVCDSWFASVPSQTFVNRLFSLCGSSYEGHLDDTEFASADLYPGYGTAYDLPSIFEALDHANTGALNWKLYFHDYSMSAGLIQYVNGFLTAEGNQNLANFSHVDYPPPNPITPPTTTNPIAYPTTTFLEDVLGHSLAPFSVIEPRYSNNYPGATPGLFPNSNHPGGSNYVLLVTADDPPIDVINGEMLLLEVYLALRLSPYWPNTLLIVTYDEPGGLYDHVAPPSATPPDSTSAFNGFQFNWLGGRVPTIIVSPFAPAGSQLVAPQGKTFDHTSIIATVLEYLAPSSTYFAGNARVAAAPTIDAATGLTTSADNNPDPAAVPQVGKG